jgi:catechol 2,3-dioxygenase-like lactoylglutathione lyase family enzyme
MTDRSHGMRVKGLDHVSVTCRDLDASVHFYRDLLGLPFRAQGEADEPELEQLTGFARARIRWAELELGNGRILELVEFVVPRAEPAEGDLNAPGRGHIGLEVEGIEALRDALVAAGVAFRSSPVRWTEPGDWFGVQVVYAEDPDGVVVELVDRSGGR